jgi:cytochrome c oxidase subunit II
MRHFVIAAVLVILVSVLTYLGLGAVGLMPDQAAEQAASIDWLLDLQWITISFLFSLIMVPLVYSLVVFRRKAGETGDGEHIEGNTRLELLWTIIPLFVVLIFAYLGAYTLAETRRVDPQAMEVRVVAFQWSWRYEYPQYGITSTELYLPLDQQVLLKMESPDVIHSFWVPEFRVKQDIVPGRVTELRITPTQIGEYKVRCAELCGVAHAYMLSPVVVVAESDFQAWVLARQAEVAESETGEPDPERGRRLVTDSGCVACHSYDGSPGIGPTWKGLYGSQRQFTDGSSAIADGDYIRESILDPDARIVVGFAPGMPPYQFTDGQFADIIAFIESLK